MTKEELLKKKEEKRKALEEELKKLDLSVNREIAELERREVLEQEREKLTQLPFYLEVIKKSFYKNIVPLLGETKQLEITVSGYKFTIDAVNNIPKVKKHSGVVVEKNSTSTKVEGKESLTSKVKRMSKLNPNIHVTQSQLNYSKAARIWLIKNFGTVEV